MHQKKEFGKGALVGAIAALAVSGLIGWGILDFGQGALSVGEIRKLSDMKALIKEYYLGEMNEDEMLDGLYRGYIKSLDDPYAEYYSPEDMRIFESDISGEMSGIGALLTQDMITNMVIISEVYEGSPAQRAGLQAEDIICRIDGEEIYELTLDEIVNQIVGEPGTEVSITVIRGEAGEEMSFTAVREQIESVNVAYQMLDESVGYILINQFTDTSIKQFEQALQALEAQKMKGLVIDLRDNPGGNLDAVCEIGDQLLPEGLIVYTEDKNGSRSEYYSDEERQLDLPLTVLINGDSASASEILAGAVQDYGKGVVVGTQSFGKGLVQDIFVFDDGSGVKITSEEYFTPNGRNINGKGITPDIFMEDAPEGSDADTDPQLDKAVEILKEKIEQNS